MVPRRTFWRQCARHSPTRGTGIRVGGGVGGVRPGGGGGVRRPPPASTSPPGSTSPGSTSPGSTSPISSSPGSTPPAGSPSTSPGSTPPGSPSSSSGPGDLRGFMRRGPAGGDEEGGGRWRTRGEQPLFPGQDGSISVLEYSFYKYEDILQGRLPRQHVDRMQKLDSTIMGADNNIPPSLYSLQKVLGKERYRSKSFI